MKYPKLLVLASLLFVSSSAWSQVNYQQQYLNAKQLFSDGKYSLAMEALKPFMEPDTDNLFSAYASFYYAAAAYKDGYPPMAKNMFLQIKERFPKWSKIEEVNFWLGKIYFENKEYNQGLNILKEIRDKAFKEDVYNLKYHTFSQIKDQELLKDLYTNRPNESVVGEVLARRIASQPLFAQDQELLDELIRKFKLNEAGLENVMVEETIFKDQYKVAVLFPFLMENLEPDDRRKVNQLVLDAYLGIQLAVDTLKAAGINIELFAYDTRRDSATTAAILQHEEMQGMDLIIGPLFTGPRMLVQEFSFKNKINMINPLSSDSDVIGINPYSFLLHPTDETIGHNTAAYVAKSLRDKPGIIFYGQSKGDSALAFAYKERIEKEGFEIIMTKEIKRDSTRQILDILLISNEEVKAASTDEAKENYTIALDSISHVFVASNNDLISTKVLSAVETRGDSTTVVGSAAWLDLSIINYDVYHRLQAVLYAPMYVRKETEAYKNFRTDYVKLHKVPPSSFAELGYELMQFMGHNLHNYGKYFQLGWNEKSFREGYLTIGYSYKNAQYNTVVPILEFGKEGLEISYEIEEQNNEDSKE
ncbi:MAG: ABC transporter substrate-binding protein [Fulvivirga sp.]